MKLLASASLASVLLATGCATVTRGTTQSIAIDTEPQRAQVSSSTGGSCISPCSLTLKRNLSHTVTAKIDGYEPRSAVVSPVINSGGGTAFAGNILVGGLIGAGVDAASGAMYDLAPSSVTLILREEQK